MKSIENCDQACPSQPKKLTLNLAIAAALISGYGSRKVFAGDCIGAAGTYTCSGAADINNDDFQTFSCSSGTLSLTTTPGFGIDTSPFTGSVIRLNGNAPGCNLSLNDAHQSTINARQGIRLINNSNAGQTTMVTTTGSINVTYGAAIYNRQDGASGDVTINTNDGTITAESDGIRSINSSTAGASSMITSNGIINANTGINASVGTDGNNLTINTGVNSEITGANSGIIARNESDGETRLTLNGSINSRGVFATISNGNTLILTTGDGDIISNAPYSNGIYHRSLASGPSNITTGSGTVSGASRGISSQNRGSGNSIITTNGPISGSSREGLLAYIGNNVPNLSITTGTGSITGGIYGIRAQNYSNANAASIDVTTHGDVTGTTRDGIFATNYFSSAQDINISTVSGTISGQYNGIRTFNNGNGTININHSANAIGEMDTGINATTNANSASDINIVSSGNVSGQRVGISAENFGIANNSVSVTTTSGQITATDYNGINANNARAESNNVSINTTDSIISGYRKGLNAINNGYGTITLTTSGSSITGATQTGIYARNYDAGGDINITTNGSTINGLLNGISVRNDSTVGASVNITSSSDITSELGSAISANNNSGESQNITVMATGGNIEGSDRGISVNNSGTGTTVVDASAYITSSANFGSAVDVRAQSSSADIMITGNGTLVGGGGGINVENNSDANNSITINTTGNITGSTQPGIQAVNNNVSSLNLSIDTGAGTINGATSAIVANNYGTGSTNVTTGGQVTGGQTGIFVRNNANAGDINVSTTGGNVTGDSTRGIDISNYSEQSGSINVNISGDVTSTQGSAIFVRSVSSSSYGITVNIDAGNIIGERTGVSADHEGSGPVTIINNGNITANNIVGLNATSAGSAIDITNTGNVTGGSFGISAFSTNNGDITISTSGTVSATAFAINTYSSNPSDADVVIDINPGSIINGGLRDQTNNSTVTINNNTDINGAISLGAGNDLLIIDGADVSDVTRFDGGGDLSNGTTFTDTINFGNVLQTIDPSNIVNWQNINIEAGSHITLSGDNQQNTLITEYFGLGNTSTLSQVNGRVGDVLSIGGTVELNGTVALDVSLQNSSANIRGNVIQADLIRTLNGATGNATIDLIDVGSQPSLTSNQGVLLIENAGPPNASFSLFEPFSLEDYDYKLIRVDDSWFLRSLEVDVAIDVNLISQAPFVVGDEVVYQIEVSNNGPDPAKNIVIEGGSSNLDFISLNNSSCSPATLPCTIQTLASGESQNFTYRATINSAGFFRLNGSAQITTELDLNASDNVDDTDNSGSTEPLLIPSLNQLSTLLLGSLLSLAAFLRLSRRNRKYTIDL